MSSRLSTSAVVIDRQLVRRGAERLAVVGDEALHVADDGVEVLDRLPDLVGVVGQQRRDRRQVLVELPSRSVLSCSADTRIDRFLTVAKMSVLWSPSADNACDSLMTVSRMVAPCPRRLSAAVLTNAPSVLTPPGSVGCSSSVSRSKLLAHVVPLDRHRGAVLRDHRAVLQRRARRCRRASAGSPERSPAAATGSTALASAGTLYVAVDPERDLDPVGLRLDLVDSRRPARRGCARRRRGRGRCCCRSTPTTMVRSIVTGGPHGDDHAGDQHQRPGPRPATCGTSAPAITAGAPGTAAGPHRVPARRPVRASAPVRTRAPAAAGAGGPGGGPPGGGAGSGSRYG